METRKVLVKRCENCHKAYFIPEYGSDYELWLEYNSFCQDCSLRLVEIGNGWRKVDNSLLAKIKALIRLH